MIDNKYVKSSFALKTFIYFFLSHTPLSGGIKKNMYAKSNYVSSANVTFPQLFGHYEKMKIGEILIYLFNGG